MDKSLVPIWEENHDMRTEQIVQRHRGGSTLGLWLDHRKGESTVVEN